MADDPITRHHLNSLQTGKVVRGVDGRVGTVRTIQVDIGGVPTLIPSIWDGKILNDRDATRRALESGIKWPTAKTHEELRKLDIKIHERFDEDLQKSMESDQLKEVFIGSPF